MRYKVMVCETTRSYTPVEVEAATQQEAEQMAYDMAVGGEVEFSMDSCSPEYETTNCEEISSDGFDLAKAVDDFIHSDAACFPDLSPSETVPYHLPYAKYWETLPGDTNQVILRPLARWPEGLCADGRDMIRVIESIGGHLSNLYGRKITSSLMGSEPQTGFWVEINLH